MFTTSEEDQRKVAKLKERLAEQADETSTTNDKPGKFVPSVSIDEGTNKYVLISADNRSKEKQYFVVSAKGASYHQDAAEPFVDKLSWSGYSNINVTGGGRIRLDSQAKAMCIYGFSYGFGQADHELSKETVLADPRYADFMIETSNEGY